LAPGLWRWTGRHEEWKQDVGCVYYEHGADVCLIDPLLPPEDPDRFWAALDRDVARAGGDVHVLLTVFWHARSAAELVARYGASLWAPSRAKAAVERRAGTVTKPFHAGALLPAGIKPFASGRSTEVVFWLPEDRALVTGDVILGDAGGELRLCPESWLPAGTGHPELRRALRPLLELDVEQVVVSHGESVLEGGAEALRVLLR
ncbi:MAG TPA: MBL fold metallo-hydrolase, partial [bacterium]|nr:MBL fold metallo-hydrolase [bacterium]